MKTISPELLATIQRDRIRLAALVRITRRDGVVLGFTDYNKPLPFEGVDYLPGYKRTAIESSDSLKVNRFDVDGWINHDNIGDVDMRAGLYDASRWAVYFVNPRDLTQGALQVPGGIAGTMQIDNPNGYKIEVSSLTQLYEQEDGELYSMTCNAHLGDARCKFVITPDVGTVATISAQRRTFTATGTFHSNDLLAVPTWQAGHIYYNRMSVSPSSPTGFRYVALTIGKTANNEPTWPTTLYATVVDGEMLWQAVDNSPGSYDDWYRYGRLVWTSGLNEGFGCEVQAYNDATAEFKLWPYAKCPFDIAADDTFTVEVGCDKEPMTCALKFNNMLNHRGHYLMRGERKLLQAPDATVIKG